MPTSNKATPARPLGLRAARALVAVAVVMTASALLLGGCLLTMPEPLLKQRKLDKGVIPVLRGRWLDPEGAKCTITPLRGTNNTFTAVSGRQDGALLVTLERLDDSRFILQIAPKDGIGVFLTVAEADERRIVIYTYPDSLEEIRKSAETHGVTVTDKGLIVKYTSAEGVIDFFRDLAARPEHKDFVLTRR